MSGRCYRLLAVYRDGHAEFYRRLEFVCMEITDRENLSRGHYSLVGRRILDASMRESCFGDSRFSKYGVGTTYLRKGAVPNNRPCSTWRKHWMHLRAWWNSLVSRWMLPVASIKGYL